MRLWHSKLIPLLDGKRLCDLHMSCCNLRGKGWGKRNVSINYLYDDPLGEEALTVYHHRVLVEMTARGFSYDTTWVEADYCGKRRPRRTCLWNKYREACKRDVPLLGHTFEMFLNDISALKERGLDVKVTGYLITDETGEYMVNRACCGEKEIDYTIKIKEDN